MAGPYIYIGTKYVSLDTVRSARRDEDGHYELAGETGVIDKENGEFDAVLLTIVSPQGEWECITAIEQDDGTLGAVIEPVLAFGLNVFGYVVPVTPGAPSGAGADYVLRRLGQKPVYGIGGAWFGGVEDWLESQIGPD